MRALADGVALAQVRTAMHNPAGPLAGELTATQTLVLARERGEWLIAAFHNTFVSDVPGVPALR